MSDDPLRADADEIEDGRGEGSGDPAVGGLRVSDLLRCYFAERADLVRLFAARLGSRAAGEDVVQEIYLRLVREGGGEPVDNAFAYLFRLGLNLSIDQARSEARRRRREGGWVGARESFQASGEEAAASRDGLMKVLAAVERLAPRTREVFRLHKLEGLSHAEVAARLGVSRSAVEKHMAVALRAAMEALR